MSSCVCKVCTDDIKRNMHNINYTPRWRKSKPTCKVIGCKNKLGVKLCRVTDSASIAQLLKTKLEDTRAGITLCTDHYNLVYRSLPEKASLLVHQKCKICNNDLSKKSDHHHCPNPLKIKEYLRETVGCDINITGADLICVTCYEAHKTILEQDDAQSTEY